MKDDAARILLREGGRVLAAFVVYLALYIIWSGVGARRVYEAAVLFLAGALLPLVRHFPGGRPIGPLVLRHMDLLVILSASCAIVAWGAPWRVRLRRCGCLAVMTMAAHIAALVLQAEIDVARELWQEQRIAWLLPRELQVALWAKYILFVLGLQLAPFVILGLHAVWGSNLRLLPRMERQGGVAVAVGACLLLVVLFTGTIWTWRREAQPLHVGTHVWSGDRMVRAGRLREAEIQYRAAIQGGCRSVRVWRDLANLVRMRGDKDEAMRILQVAGHPMDDDRGPAPP